MKIRQCLNERMHPDIDARFELVIRITYNYHPDIDAGFELVIRIT